MEIDTTYQKLPSETIDQYNARVAAYNAGKSGAPQDQPPVSLKPTGNNLLDFKNAMDWATNLAKQKRNVLSLDFMKPLSGTVAASDFGSILGNLNRASDTFSSDIIKNAVDQATPQYDTISDATGAIYQVQKDATGKIVGQPQLLFKGKPPTGDSNGIDVTPAYAGEFAATIDLAANTGGTNQQRNAIKNTLQNFIGNKDYASAYALIQQATAAGLKGEAATRFQNQTNALGVLSSLRSAIKAYADAGGNTNILKGTADQIQTKIGNLMTDPKYASLAVQLDAAFQQYRLQMTGAAFGAQESAEYASILPNKGNTLDLNLAKIDGAERYFRSSIGSSVKSVVGEGGNHIRDYADLPAQSPQPTPTGRIRVQLKDGRTGSIEAKDFDAKTMKKI